MTLNTWRILRSSQILFYDIFLVIHDEIVASWINIFLVISCNANSLCARAGRASWTVRIYIYMTDQQHDWSTMTDLPATTKTGRWTRTFSCRCICVEWPAGWLEDTRVVNSQRSTDVSNESATTDQREMSDRSRHRHLSADTIIGL